MNPVPLRPLSILAGVVLAFAAMGQGEVQDPVPAEGADLLGRIREAYSQCESYRDEGEVRTVFISAEGRRRTVTKPFKTAFVRPGGFRFEYRDRSGEEEWDEYVIWIDEDGAHSWWTIKPEVRDWDGLSMAVAAATGVSSGSSYRVPSLLMPGQLGGRLELPDGSRIVGEEALDERACYKVEDPSGDTLWFDKETLLLRKVFGTHELNEGVSTESTTTYRAEFDVEIPEAELVFEPPSK